MTGFDIGGFGGLPQPRVQEGAERAPAGGAAPGGFGAALADALEEVARLGDDVSAKAGALARGEEVEVHDLMVAMGKSEVAFNLMLEVRNKILEAWESLSRSAG